MPQFPEGKFLATVKVSDKGQIVIPKEVREMLGIKPGDSLLILADIEKGIAIPRAEDSAAIQKHIFERSMQ